MHLVNKTDLLTTYLIRDSVYLPETEPSYLERLVTEVPLKPPLTFFPDMHRRIAAAVQSLAMKVRCENSMLFSHAAKGFIPDWDKRYDGTLLEGSQGSE